MYVFQIVEGLFDAGVRVGLSRDVAAALTVQTVPGAARMAEVMKTMAIITVFFMPLSFLAGIYGMNFDRDAGNMPELGWTFGYYWFWALVVVIVVGLYIWLKRKRWI